MSLKRLHHLIPKSYLLEILDLDELEAHSGDRTFKIKILSSCRGLALIFRYRSSNKMPTYQEPNFGSN